MEFIDPLGELWDGGSDALKRHLGASISGVQFEQYLVRNLGWVLVQTKSNVCTIQCRPQMMSEASLAELLFKIHDAREGTIFAIDFGLEDGVLQVIRDPDIATTVLSSLVGADSSHHFWDGARFLSRAISEDQTPFNATSHQLRLIIESAIDFDARAAHIGQLLNTRWSISSFNETDGDWIEQFNSGGFTPFNPGYPGRHKGSRLSEYASDPDYMRWVSECRRQVIEEGRVDLSAVDAIVQFDRVGEARLRYNRLCVPIQLNGRSSVLMAAQTDPSIDLRQ